jgi:PilZ domain
MTDELVARRYAAAEFPEIQGVYLSPPGAAATLVNLSATGVLVGCAARLAPGMVLTVQFKGTFRPATIESRVVRCEVAGIAPDGSLLFQIGLAFSAHIALAQDADAAAEKFAASEMLEAAVAAPRGPVTLPRNRW